MQFSSRFTIAVHVVIAMEYFKNQLKTTSSFLAESVNTNPVIIRNILRQLKKAGIVKVDSGVGGSYLLKPSDEITLLDIFNAVEEIPDGIFHFHENPNLSCPIGGSIHRIMDHKLDHMEKLMMEYLDSFTIKDLLDEVDS